MPRWIKSHPRKLIPKWVKLAVSVTSITICNQELHFNWNLCWIILNVAPYIDEESIPWSESWCNLKSSTKGSVMKQASEHSSFRIELKFEWRSYSFAVRWDIPVDVAVEMVNGQQSFNKPDISGNNHGRSGQRQTSEDNTVAKANHIFVRQGTGTDGHQQDRYSQEYFKNEQNKRKQQQQLSPYVCFFHGRLMSSCIISQSFIPFILIAYHYS